MGRYGHFFLKCKYSYFIWFKKKKKEEKEKKNSHSFLNVHDSPTVLVHGPHAETHVMATTKKNKNKKTHGVKKN